MPRQILFLFALSLYLPLSACGGGGGGNDNTNSGGTQPDGYTVNGIVYKGPINGAAISVHALRADGSAGALLGSSSSSSDGAFTVQNVEDSDSGCIVITAAGGSFVDEATEETVTLGSDDMMGVATCHGNNDATVTISPLTNAALARARRLASEGMALSTAIARANDAVGRQWGLPDIVGVQPLDPFIVHEPAGSMEERLDLIAQLSYGMLLAGLSESANFNGVASFDLATAIADDVSDGLLDGMQDGTPISMPGTAGGEVPLSTRLALGDVQMMINASPTPEENGFAGILFPPNPIPLASEDENALRITTVTIPAFVSESGGSFTLEATGGSGTRQWTLIGGVLPSGLSLAANGTISGTTALSPGTTMSVTLIEVRVTDETGASTSQYFSITVVSGPPSVSGDATPTGYVGLAFSTQYSAVGGVPPYYFSLASGTGFPPLGVLLSPDGVLSGTPSVTGTSNFAVCATDLVGATDCMDVSMTVEEAPALAGLWSGTYSRTSTGDGGCTYQSSGTLEFDITSSDGVNFAGDAYADGIMLRYIPSCDFAYYTYAYGDAALVLGTDASVTGTVTVFIAETGKDYVIRLRGTLSGDTISGDVVAGDGTTVEGTFSVNRQ